MDTYECLPPFEYSIWLFVYTRIDTFISLEHMCGLYVLVYSVVNCVWLGQKLYVETSIAYDFLCVCWLEIFISFSLSHTRSPLYIPLYFSLYLCCVRQSIVLCCFRRRTTYIFRPVYVQNANVCAFFFILHRNVILSQCYFVLV